MKISIVLSVLKIATLLLLTTSSVSAQTFLATTFEIKTTVQGKCLDVSGYSGGKGHNVQIYNCDQYQDQRWYLYDPVAENVLNPFNVDDNDIFEIRNAKTGKCLDISGYEALSNSTAQIWDCEHAFDQWWSFSNILSAGYSPVSSFETGATFQLLNQRNVYYGSYRCLDVAGTTGSSGNNVQLWTCLSPSHSNGPDQVWTTDNIYDENLTH